MKACGGSIIRNVRSEQFPGTFGCLVRRHGHGEALFILGAAHVIALNGHAVRGDDILVHTSSGSEKIAQYEAMVPMRPADGAFQVCDAAIARVTHVDRVSAEIGGFGLLQGSGSDLYRGKSLQLHGATSDRIAQAELHSTGVDVRVDYSGYGGGAPFTLRYRGQILYGRLVAGGRDAQRVTLPGDSGALVMDRYNLAVGLHIASTPSDYPIDASVCTPIDEVLAALDLELVTAHNLQLRAPDLRPSGEVSVASEPVLATAASAEAPPVPAAGLRGAPAISERSVRAIGRTIDSLLVSHGIFDSVQWKLSAEGLIVDGKLERTAGPLVTVPRVWSMHGHIIRDLAQRHRVPVELIIATICTESSGTHNPPRREPGWVSDHATPGKVSHGLMQTLLSTAREALGNPGLMLGALDDPGVSIDAGTAYIAAQADRTLFDPPLVAAAYNAGGVYSNGGAANRWKTRQYPIGTGRHVDRFVAWFNDCFALFESLSARGGEHPASEQSFFRILRG